MALTVFGRDDELQAVERFLDTLPSGPTALVLEGSAGIGKTALWRAATELGDARSYRVLSCQPAESEAKLSLAALGDLLRDIQDDAFEVLPGPQRNALEVALLRRGSRGRPPNPRALATGVRTVLVDLASRTPLLVAVDDLQWLDIASARVLEFALRRLGEAPVGILCSRRLGDARGERVAVDQALPHERVQRVYVGPLSLAALHYLVQAKLGRTLPRPVLVRVAQTAEGNPLFALEIARVLLERGIPSPGEPLPVPREVERLVADRTSALPKRAQEAMLVAAALPDARENLVGAALGRPPARDLEPAERAQMVELNGGVVCFAHPLFAAAVYSAASTDRRRRLHRRLAQLVDDPEQKARHLALGAEGPDEDVARALEHAARAVGRRGVATAAAELAEQAVNLTQPDAVAARRRRARLAADHHFHAGDLDRARALLEDVVADVPNGTTRGRALLRLGEVRYHQESFTDALEIFREAAEAAANDPPIAALIQVQLAHAHVAAGDFDGAGPHAQRALESAAERSPPGVLAEVLAVSAMVEFLRGYGLDEQKLDRALALEDREREVVAAMRPSMIGGCLMLYVGRIAEARTLLRAVRERIVERGQESDLPFVSANLAWVECWGGALSAATEYAREAEETARGLGSPSVRTFALAYGALVAALRGDAPAARAAVEETLALVQETGYVIGSFWARSAAAVLELSLGNAAAADDALAPLTSAVEERGLREPITAFFLADQIEALIALGRLDRAERLLAMLDECALKLDRAWALAAAGRCRAVLLAARGDGGPALGVLDEALAQHRRVDTPLELARTLLARGTIERREKHKSAARESLEQAVGLFDRAGAALWAQRAREELDRIGLRPRAPDDLTPSETRVAELAAGGLTNREVAAAAFMAQKTVEANLTRIYRKLGIRSRAELGVRLRKQAPS